MRMRTLLFCILHSAFCLRAWGQDFAIDWFTIDGGGGESTDGYYAISGSIGQPDAGELSDGYYKIAGGYWAVVAPLATWVPWLTIDRTGSNAVMVSWPAPAPGWVLQEGWSLPNGPWYTIISPLTEAAGRLQALLPKASEYKFYRLTLATGTPVLTIQPTGTNTIIAWPAPAPGWILEQCSPSAGGVWTLPNAPCSRVGNQIQVVLPASAYNDLFRLVQAPGLRIARGSTNTIVVSWFATALGWVLQECPSLASNTWSTVTTTPVQAGAETRVTLPAANGGAFFRLAQASHAPRLTITRTDTNSVVVSWPLQPDGWVLECTNRLTDVSEPWPQISPPYETNATQAWIVTPATTGNRFYRLHRL